ncbi:hypothetical protein P7C73_g2307, partial [Tremellales sp. Uapishka_1]
MNALPLQQWDHTLFPALQQLLARATAQPTTSLLRKLEVKLQEAQPWLLTLTQLPGPNDNDKRYIETNSITALDGRSVPMSLDILSTANQLSTTLSISQLLSAAVTLQAVSERPRYPSRSLHEVSVYILHDSLSRMLDFLVDLLQVTHGSQSEAGPPFDSLREFVDGLFSVRYGKPEGTIVDQLIGQLEEIQGKMDELLRSSASNTAEYELLSFRVSELRSEQNKLARLLGIVGECGLLRRAHVLKCLRWLKKCGKPDGIMGSVLAAFIAATKPLFTYDEDDGRYAAADSYCRDLKFLKLACKEVFQEQWTIPQLQEAVKIQWSTFFLSALKYERTVSQCGLDAPMLENFTTEASTNGAFPFLHQMVVSARRAQGLEERDDREEAAEDTLVKLANKIDKANDGFFFAQIQDVVDSLATRRHFVRNLKTKEEDVGLKRSQAIPPPANYQSFLYLVASVYKSLAPDSASHLWDDQTFINAVIDGRGGWPGPAFWEMMSAISTGATCAAKSYERIKTARTGWNMFFQFYQHYYEIMPHLFDPIKTTRNPCLEPMPHDEVQICKGFTILISTVAKWSSFAREALLQSKPYPLHTLFDFLNCDIPLDLKAAVLDAITAFCSRKGNAQVDEDVLAKAVDYYERISFVDGALDVRSMDGSRIPAPIGWIAKMEYSEQDVNTYPLTKSYLQFLTCLLPPPSSLPKSPRLINTLRRSTFYVLDRTLLPPRRFSKESERWGMLDGVFGYLEKALLAFDMSDLLGQINTRAIGQVATGLADEPGFLVLLRLLSETAILAPLTEVIDQFAQVAPEAIRPALMDKVTLRVLRIFHRILHVQLVFSDVLLLTLSDPARNPTHPFRRPLSLQSLDHHLLHHTSNVTAIALSVGHENPEIAFLSTRIVSALASSPVFSRSDLFRGEHTTSVNRLAGILETSDDSLRIAQGFCMRLDGDGEDLLPSEILSVEEAVLAGNVSPEYFDALPFVIRSAILDLLVDGTSHETNGPNLAHFLLGFDFRSNEFGLQDPSSDRSRLSTLHIVLRQISESPALITVHPTIAAKSAKLIHQLCSHPVTSKAALSFTSSVGYAAQQLAALPSACPEATREVEGLGSAETSSWSVVTSADTLTAYLDFQRWILSSVALETFAYDGDGVSSDVISASLFGQTEREVDEDQRPPLLIDLLSAIDIQWTDNSSAVADKALEFYSSFDFDQYKRVEVDWYDLDPIAKGLEGFRKQLERTGAISIGPSMDAINEEKRFILERLASKNRETEISLAKGNFLTAWNEIQKVSLALVFKNVSEEKQEGFLFDLLDALLDRYGTENAAAPGVVEIICESVLVTITTLVNVLMEFEGINLPVDRLSNTLKKMVDALTKPGSTENARGNLYAAISQYLQLLAIAPSISDTATTVGTVTTTSTSTLQRSTLSVLMHKKERLLPILCRDAMDDRDVWKTQCFALLSGLATICGNERDRSLLSPLIANGFLPLFVRSIKDREMALQECLGPDPDNLHAYWVYEAKLTFLMALAATKKGAEELLDAGVFEMFAMCGFINVQPVMDESMDTQSVSRQHRILICALQLLIRVLSSLHKSSRSGAGHAISFLNAHRESILMLLRENQQNITLTGIEECRLILSMFCLVVHKVPAEDMRSPSGFGAYHLGVLALSAKFFDRDTWIDNVLLEDDFQQVDAKVLELNQITLTYLCSTTAGLKAGSGFPVFVTGGQRKDGNATRFIASAPSLQMAIQMLSELADIIGDITGYYEDLLERLNDGSEIDEGTLQTLKTLDLPGDESITAASIVLALSTRTSMVFNMVESLLLLIWRHLLYYANDARDGKETIRPDNISVGMSVHGGNGRVLERVAAGLKGVLERLQNVDLPEDLSTSRNGGKEDAYYGMLVRRLKELTAGLTGEMDED